jgi:long-chain acyl-CoA synthetase
MKLGDIVAEAAQTHSKKTALIFKGQKTSFEEFFKNCDRVANGLLKTGIKTGDKVAILLENRPEYFYSYYGAHRIGAPVVPINNFLKGEEIKYICEDCSVTSLITSPRYYQSEIKPIENKLTTVKSIIIVGDEEEMEDIEYLDSDIQHLEFRTFFDQSSEEPQPTKEFSAEDLAVIIYTSGTTGHPKGAMLSHRNLVRNSASCMEVLHVTKKDKVLLYLPMFHSFTELVCMVLPVHWGLPIVLIERIDRVEIRAAIKRFRPTIMVGVPSVYSALLGAKLNILQRWLNPIRLYVSGGAPLPVEVIHKFEEKFRRPLVEGYGLSEASPVVSVNPIDGVRKPGSVGLPVVDVEVKVVDDDGKVLGKNEDGELCVRGPNVMMGYFNQPEETANTLKEGWLFTGDVAHIDDDGYIFIVERKKDMLIYRGCNIYPREVEEVLYKHPAVADAAVVGIPDASRGEVPKAFIVLKEGEHATEKELKKFCADHLARYKVPKLFSFEKDLPRTPTGKVLKKDLRKKVLKEQIDNLNNNS